MRRVTWAIVCAAMALTMAGCERFRMFGGNDHKRVNLNIVLVMDASGRCTARQPLQGHAQKKDKVTFQVTNNCSADYYVKLWHFRKINPDTLEHVNVDTPVFDADPVTNKVVTANGGTASATGTVNDLGIGSQDDPPVFKYIIAISASAGGTFDTALDPDFEIWP